MTLSVLERDNETMRDVLDILAHGAPSYERSRPIRDWSTSRIRWDLRRREVYSYGDHFPLFRFIPRGRRRPLIVLNGDQWRGGGWHPSRTPDHQWQARALARELGAETIVIPFSALEGAAIDIDSVRPVQVRDDSEWSETFTVDSLAEVPSHLRQTYHPASGRTVDRAPDETGRYSWSERRHRLGDCLFSAVRVETYTRPARAFETDSETARAIVECPAPRERYCHAAAAATDNRTDLHAAGPSGACIYCTRPLEARVTVRRRALYLSSFDYQERAPLYFLAQLPRGARADTVDAAIDSLAPRAVHAARARGIPVERQGDIFFIRTGLTLEQLEARGIASRARLTQWTRDARAKRGEVGYTRPLDAAGRRRMAKFRRAEYWRIIRGAREQVTAPRPLETFEAREARRSERTREYALILERHKLQRALAAASGYGPEAPESSACVKCGAAIGARCNPEYASSAYRACWTREPLGKVQREEISGFKNRTGRFIGPGPQTLTRGARAQWAKRRADHARELESARAELRRAVFGLNPRGYASRYSATRYSEASRYDRLAPLQRERRAILERVRRARERLASLEARGARDANGFRTRAAARDAYRSLFKNPPACAAWSMAGVAARARFIPSENHGPAIEARRAKVRRALSVYGTAHSAREVIRTRAGAVYVSGTVRHVPALEPNRTGAPDHAPLELGTGYWLAVRNTVPRSDTRRRA